MNRRSRPSPYRAIVVAAAALGLLVAVIAALVAERRYRRFDVDLVPLRASSAEADAAEGRRLGFVLGCLGCHGSNGGGRVLFESAALGRIAAPNLTRVLRAYSEPEFARLLRRGVRRDGTSTVIMPTSSFAKLADADIAALWRYLAVIPPVADNGPVTMRWGPVGVLALLSDKMPLSADLPVEPAPPRRRPHFGPANGSYWVATACTHCHRLAEPREIGDGKSIAPPLRDVVGGYSEEQLIAMLRSGRAPDGRSLGVMSEATTGLRHLTDAEIRNLSRAFAQR